MQQIVVIIKQDALRCSLVTWTTRKLTTYRLLCVFSDDVQVSQKILRLGIYWTKIEDSVGAGFMCEENVGKK